MTTLSAARREPNEKERSAARSREAILDAAEQLFAERGYESTSLTDVGKLAGLSRATPGYFFGSKPELYRAVLERCYDDVRQAVRSGRERARASGQASEIVLAGAVADYFEFLRARPNFVRLIEWEALSGGRALDDVPPRLTAAQEMLTAIAEEIGEEAGTEGEAAHLLLSIIALCWFPLVHSGTLLRAIGLDPDDPAYAERRRRHIINLVLHGVGPRLDVSLSPVSHSAPMRPR